jgi:hypothetical protein
VAGLEPTGDAPVSAPAATQKPATPGRLMNVLQTATAEVVFASPAKGKGK